MTASPCERHAFAPHERGTTSIMYKHTIKTLECVHVYVKLASQEEGDNTAEEIQTHGGREVVLGTAKHVKHKTCSNQSLEE